MVTWDANVLSDLVYRGGKPASIPPAMQLPKKSPPPRDMEGQRKGYFLARLGILDNYDPGMSSGPSDYLAKAEDLMFQANQLNRQAVEQRTMRPVQFNGGPTVNVQAGGSPVAQTKGGGRLNAFINAIAGKESGGSYSAVNQDSGALGKYQIMPGNISGAGGWDSEALGKNVTTQQFLSNPKLQEAIARYKLTQYFNKYGARGAASAWYSGDPNKWRNNSPQGGYPSIYNYVMAILKAMGQ